MKVVTLFLMFSLLLSCKKELKFKLKDNDYKNFIQATIKREPTGKTFFEINVIRFGISGNQNTPSIQSIGGVLINQNKYYNINFIKGNNAFIPGIILGNDITVYSARIDSAFVYNSNYDLRLFIDNDTINATATLTDTIRQIATNVQYINSAKIQTYHKIIDQDMALYSYAFEETVDDPNIYFEGDIYKGQLLSQISLPSKKYWGCIFPTFSQTRFPVLYKMTSETGRIYGDFKKNLYNNDEPLVIPYSFNGNIHTPRSYGYFLGFCATTGSGFVIEDKSDTAIRLYFKDKNGNPKNLKSDYELIKIIADASSAKEFFSHTDNYAFLSKNALCTLITLKNSDDCDSNGELSRDEDITITVFLRNKATNQSIATVPHIVNSSPSNQTVTLTIPE